MSSREGTLSPPEEGLDRIEALLERADARVRLRVARQLAVDYAGPGFDRTARAVRTLDDVFLLLVARLDVVGRAELAGVLSRMNVSPPGILRFLSNDDQAVVAGPILRESPLITDRELAEIASIQSQAHLLAIAQRRNLAVPVSDVTIDRGGSEVRRVLAANRTARLSARGLLTLVRAAALDAELNAALRENRTLPHDVVTELLAQVKRGFEPPSPEPASIQAARRLDRHETTDLPAAAERLGALGRRVLEDDVVAFAEAGRWDDAVAATALIAKVPLAVVAEAMTGKLEQMMMALRAANFSWSTVEVLVRLRLEAAGARRGLADLRQTYARLTLPAAGRALQAMAARSRLET